MARARGEPNQPAYGASKAGIVGIEEAFEEKGIRLPLMISVTITDRSGRTLSGQTVDAFYVSIAHANPFSVGINCALGAREMRPYLAELSRAATTFVSGRAVAVWTSVDGRGRE